MTREQRLLRFNAFLITIPFGILFAAGAWPPIYDLLRFFFVFVHWPFNPAPEVLEPTARLLIAIGGGVAAGLGAATWMVATHVLPVAPEAGRRVLFAAGGTWFVTDSTFSVVAGSPMNVVPNVVLLAMLVGPSLMAAREDRAA
ncbi:MAG: hypothetical protein AAFO93_13935 [Pseudomonadota bacterium]